MDLGTYLSQMESVMSMSQEELFKSALALPEGERILLATELLDSIESGASFTSQVILLTRPVR